ncbi:hypothetical protein FB451DRAFT_1365918 [Mycena latifolia]|nr:hypothetical protein FB451DRAFT_1365918 [Mycena latifolia]
MSATDTSTTAIESPLSSATDVPDIDEVPVSLDDAIEPPSPGGSTKGLYVRSRPTSLDGAPIDFPGINADLDFSEFGMTPAPAAPTVFPLPPVISPPPPGKKRRYAASVRSLSMGMGSGTGTSLKTNRAPIVPVQLVRRKDTELSDTDKVTKRRGAWGMNALKKIVPGLFPRPTAGTRAPLGPSNAQTLAPVPADPPTPHPARARALSIRSFKSGRSKMKALRTAGADADDAENRPPVPVLVPRTRMHSFSGFLTAAAVADDEDTDEDETDAEMTAITLEAVQTALRLNEEYEFALVDPDQIGIATRGNCQRGAEKHEDGRGGLATAYGQSFTGYNHAGERGEWAEQQRGRHRVRGGGEGLNRGGTTAHVLEGDAREFQLADRRKAQGCRERDDGSGVRCWLSSIQNQFLDVGEFDAVELDENFNREDDIWLVNAGR